MALCKNFKRELASYCNIVWSFVECSRQSMERNCFVKRVWNPITDQTRLQSWQQLLRRGRGCTNSSQVIVDRHYARSAHCTWSNELIIVFFLMVIIFYLLVLIASYSIVVLTHLLVPSFMESLSRVARYWSLLFTSMEPALRKRQAPLRESPGLFHETLWWLEEIGIQRSRDSGNLNYGEKKPCLIELFKMVRSISTVPLDSYFHFVKKLVLEVTDTNWQKYTVDATRVCTSSLFKLCVNRLNDLPQEAFEVTITVNSFKSHLDRIRHIQMDFFMDT